MPINFNKLAKESGGNAFKPLELPEGPYIAKITKAEMKQGKDPNRPPYLNTMLEIYNQKREKLGVIFDIITEPTSAIVEFKLRRFVEALKLPISGEFELATLAKIAVNKEFIVYLKVDKRQNPARTVVDVFKDDIYYTIDQEAEVFGITDSTMDNEDFPF